MKLSLFKTKIKVKDLNELIEEIAVFCDRFPKTRISHSVEIVEIETDWYICRFIKRDIEKEWEIYAKVKNGEALRISQDDCFFCGEHSPVGGGHLFLGRQFDIGWYYNRQGWITNKELQFCPKCKHKIFFGDKT